MKRLIITLITISIALLTSKVTIGQINFDDYEKALNLNNKAVEELKKNNFQEAANLITDAIILDSTNRSAYLNLNYAFSMINKFDSIIVYLDDAIQIFKEDDELTYHIGNAYLKLNNFKKALPYFNDAIKFSKKNGENYPVVYMYYLSRGICYQKLNQLEPALNDYSYAIKLDNSKSSVFVNRGIVLYQLKRSDEACKDWFKAKEMGAKSADSYIEKYCKSN